MFNKHQIEIKKLYVYYFSGVQNLIKWIPWKVNLIFQENLSQ